MTINTQVEPADQSDGHLPTRPLLPGFFQVVQMSPDSVQLHSAGRILRLKGNRLGDVAFPLLNALDGTLSVAEIATRLDLPPAVVTQLVRRLADEGIVQDADGPEPVSAACGAGQFFAESGRDSTTIQRALTRATVVVLGLGPVGRFVARHMAAAGVGHLVMADSRLVTTLDVAVTGGPDALGRPRSQAAEDECPALPEAHCRSVDIDWNEPSSLEPAVAGADLVVLEIDGLRPQAGRVQSWLLHRLVPVLPVAVTSVEALVGPFTADGRGPCHRCGRDRRLSHLRHFDEHLAFDAALEDGRIRDQPAALLSASASIVGGIASLEALRLIGDRAAAATPGAVMVTDFRTMETTRHVLLRVPGCPECDAGSEEVEVVG